MELEKNMSEAHEKKQHFTSWMQSFQKRIIYPFPPLPLPSLNCFYPEQRKFQWEKSSCYKFEDKNTDGHTTSKT